MNVLRTTDILELGDCWVTYEMGQESYRSLRQYLTFFILVLSFLSTVPFLVVLQGGDMFFILLFGTISVFLLAFTWFLIRYLRRLKRMSIRAYEQGLVYEFGKQVIVRWDKVISLKMSIVNILRYGSISDVQHCYTLVHKNAKPLNYPS